MDTYRVGTTLVEFHPQFWILHPDDLDLREDPADPAIPARVKAAMDRVGQALTQDGELTYGNAGSDPVPVSLYRTRPTYAATHYTVPIGRSCCRLYFGVLTIDGNDAAFPGIEHHVRVLGFFCNDEDPAHGAHRWIRDLR